jgi:endonuclease/exonuclease/phosphatase family metal-dependent hydrolase
VCSSDLVFRRITIVSSLGIALSVGLLSAPASAQTATPARAVLPLQVTPAAATPMLASASSSQLAIDWEDYAGAPRYRVRYSKYSSMKKSVYKRTYASEIVLSKLKSSTKYYVRVQAIRNDSKGTALSGYSAKTAFKTVKKLKYTAPAKITAKASARGADALVANWAFDAAGRRYELQYASNPGFTDAASIVTRGPSGVVRGLAGNTTYYLRARSVSVWGVPISSWSTVVSATTRTPADPGAKPLQVASFNVRNGTIASDTGNRSWAVRRYVVASQLRDNHIDVAGLQEAEYTSVVGADGVWKHQFQDLVDLLGKSWRITCSTSADPYCNSPATYSVGTRLIYNSETVTLRDAGFYALSLRSGDVRRFMVWGIFTQKSTGRDFFFANAHLDNSKSSAGFNQRIIQSNQIVNEIAARNTRNLPVILVGDMNSQKWRSPYNAPYRVFSQAGYVDPIGNPDKSKVAVNPTTEFRLHTEFDTWHSSSTNPTARPWINGINVDYIWVVKSVTTLDYETVVNVNDSTMKYDGPPASDHHMLRAAVLIPG